MTNNHLSKALDLPNPTLLRAAAQIQIDYPDDFIGDDVKGIEEKLRTGRSSLRTKYWREIIDASITDEIGLPLPNHAVGPWGCNPLALAIKKGAQFSLRPFFLNELFHCNCCVNEFVGHEVFGCEAFFDFCSTCGIDRSSSSDELGNAIQVE